MSRMLSWTLPALLACGAHLLILARPAFAQRDYFEAAQRQYASSLHGSFQQFEAVLKMVDAAYMFDLVESLEHSARAIELAHALQDPDGEAACYMYRALVHAWMDDKAKSEQAFQRARALFDHDRANAFHRCHYYTAFVRYELQLGEGAREIDLFLSNALASAEATQDKVLIFMTQRWAVFDQIVFGDSDPDHAGVRQVVNRMEELSQDIGLESSASAFSAYVRSRVDRNAGQSDDAVQHLENAVRDCKEAGDRTFEIVCRCRLAKLYREQEKLESVRAQFSANTEIVRHLSNPSIELKTYLDLAEVDFELSRVEEARAGWDHARQLESELSETAPSVARSLYELGLRLARHDGDFDKVADYAQLISAPEFIDKLVIDNENYRRLFDRIVELEETKNQIKRGKEELQQEFETRQAEATRIIRMLQIAFGTLVFFAAILTLGGALFYSRRRLAEARKQLGDAETSSKRNEQIRRNLEQNVQRLQRMESLGILAGGVAHDFNNLLVGVICNAELLKQEVRGDQPAEDCVEQVILAAEKAAGLSRQMLAYAGKQKIEPMPVDLNELVLSFSTTLQATIGNDHKISVETTGDAQVALCDPTQIEQAVLNLVTNARDASPQGHLTIRTGCESMETVDERYLFGSRKEPGTFVYVEVEDTGDGITDEVLERIFEPFYSERGAGRGLGLAVVYGIIEAHQGLIRVTTGAGVGTVVRVLLPASLDRVTHDPIPKKSVPRSSMAGGLADAPLVLIADDEPMVLQLAERVVAQQGWKVVTARSGSIAMDCIRQHGDRVDCILLDVVMPGLDAKEILEEMVDEAIDVPVILMSGFSQTQLGAYRDFPQVKDILEKPFRVADLEDAIRDTLSISDDALIGSTFDADSAAV